MDTLLMVIELETLKKKMDNAEAFLEELIHYIFVVCKDDDYITPEGICRKLYKYGFIDKKDGEWIADTPQPELTDRIPYDPLAEMKMKRMVEERLRQTERSE